MNNKAPTLETPSPSPARTRLVRLLLDSGYAEGPPNKSLVTLSSCNRLSDRSDGRIRTGLRYKNAKPGCENEPQKRPRATTASFSTAGPDGSGDDV